MVKNLSIVSLSAGTIGEDFVKHEVKLGLSRLENYGLKVTMMPHAMKGIEYVKKHPEDRAEDLIAAFSDPQTDMILCAIGGDDTYRLLPWLFEHDELKNALTEKIFLGFSDSTMNHLMLHKLGLPTFYGQSFLADVCELEEHMLPYTAHYFEELIQTGRISVVKPSDVWYEGRSDYSPAAMGTKLVSHKNQGFLLLQGPSHFEGEILGGCINSLYDIFDNSRYSDSVSLCSKYALFPSKEEWRGKILLLETSEEQPTPDLYAEMLKKLKAAGVFEEVAGILCGKPMDERYMEEYNQVLVEVVDDPDLPIVTNLNIGHALPRCILPFGRHAVVDTDKQEIRFLF